MKSYFKSAGFLIDLITWTAAITILMCGYPWYYFLAPLIVEGLIYGIYRTFWK